MKAIARHLRISPKKANLVAGLVRNKNVEEALSILKFTPKKAAPMLYKVIRSAAANATNNFKQKQEELVVKEIIVTQGTTMKRSVPVSRGRVHPRLKRTAHITVTVGLLEGEAVEKKVTAEPKAKDEKTEEPKSTTKSKT